MEEVTPLLNELRSGGLVHEMESLSKSISLAAAHVEQLQRAVLDNENVDALRETVKTLANTLKSIEVILDDAYHAHISHRRVLL